MERRLEKSIYARPGEFLWAAKSEAHDNRKRTKSKKVTHIHFCCEICAKEVGTPIGSAEAVAEQFDQHECKPKGEWPERPGPAPRVSPRDRAAERERLRRKVEDE